jgi:arylsulfatase A-like enzyme
MNQLAATLVEGGPGPSRITLPSVASQPASQARAAVLLRDILSVALAFGLVAGFAEAGYWLVIRRAFGRIIFLPEAAIWMTPLAYAILFTAAAASFAAGALIWRRASAVTWAVAACAFLAALALLLLVGQLMWVAQIALAAGVASVTVRCYLRRAETHLRRMRIAAAVLLAVLAAVATIERAAAGWASRRAQAALPAANGSRPNVLLLVLDTVRGDALGVYGVRPSPTPNLDRYAARGIVFDQVSATAPWTLPSTASMLTGRLPHQLSTGWHTPLDGTYPTLSEILSRQGYETAGFVANAYCARETGLARGFVHYDDCPLSAGLLVCCTSVGRSLLHWSLPLRLGIHLEPGRRNAERINEAFWFWFEGRAERPFFAFLNYIDAHDPYLAPPPFDQGRPRTFDQRRLVQFWWWLPKDHVTADQEAYLRSAYSDCVRYLDAHVGRLLDGLESRGVLDNTWVIVTSDHGEHFGDHELYGHGNSLYEAAIHVPLVVVPPAASPARRIDTPVSLQNLAATILDVAGVAGALPGRSLTDLFEPACDSPADDDWTSVAEIAEPCFLPPCHGRSPVFRGPMQSIRQGRFKYIRVGDGSEELYDLVSDRQETKNLAHDAAFDAIRRSLGDRLSTSP